MSTAKVVTILHPSSAVNNIVNDASGNVAVGGTLTASTITSAAATALTIKSAGTTAMTIDTSQNVGIGNTVTSGGRLTVTGTGGSTANSLFLNNVDGTYNPYLQFQHSSSGVKLYASSTYGGSASNLSFACGGTDVMTLNNSGNLLVGQSTSTAGRVQVGGFNSSAFVSSSGIGVLGNSHFLGALRVDGVPYANQTAWTLISDSRTKTVNDSFVDGLAAICALTPVKFTYNGKAGTTLDGVQRIGLIADDVQTVMPYCVGFRETYLDEGDAEKKEVLSLDTSPIVFALINAVKELSAKNDALEAANAAFEARLAALEAK